MFGWNKLATVEIYTKEADCKRLSRAASERIVPGWHCKGH